MVNLNITAEINKEIDEVISKGLEQAIGWLRGAFHVHKHQIDHLLRDLRELRRLYLLNTNHTLSVHEAQLLSVCRICRGEKISAPFVLNYGEEYAHQDCLDLSELRKETDEEREKRT